MKFFAWPQGFDPNTAMARNYAGYAIAPGEGTARGVDAAVHPFHHYATQTDLAETYLLQAPLEVVGVLAVNAEAMPVEVSIAGLASAVLRKATNELDVMPELTEFGTTTWNKS